MVQICKFVYFYTWSKIVFPLYFSFGFILLFHIWVFLCVKIYTNVHTKGDEVQPTFKISEKYILIDQLNIDHFWYCGIFSCL